MVGRLDFSPNRYDFSAVLKINGGAIEILGDPRTLTVEQLIELHEAFLEIERIVEKIVKGV